MELAAANAMEVNGLNRLNVGDKVELYSLEEQEFVNGTSFALQSYAMVQMYIKLLAFHYFVAEADIPTPSFAISASPTVQIRAIQDTDLQIQAQLEYLKLLNEIY